MKYVWESFILIVVGIVVLRVAGRKSLSQMTLSQSVFTISLGIVLVQPVAGDGLLQTAIVSGIFMLTTIVLEFLQVKSNFFERLILGKSVIVIENGKLKPAALKSLRLSVDQLEMKLRNAGIARITDVKTATLEPNGQLGYELTDEAKPLTAGEFKQFLEKHFPGAMNPSAEQKTIFSELKEGGTGDNSTLE